MKPTCTTFKKLRDEFNSRVENSKAYRHGAARFLYANQTFEEQDRKKTQYANGSGFTAPDAPLLSRLAEKLKAGKPLNAGEEQALRCRLPKYWGQFTRLLEPEELDSGLEGLPKAFPANPVRRN
jgi:hypothetical protein